MLMETLLVFSVVFIPMGWGIWQMLRLLYYSGSIAESLALCERCCYSYVSG
jgi:hypothetical protein